MDKLKEIIEINGLQAIFTGNLFLIPAEGIG
jgi:hypothetical protein